MRLRVNLTVMQPYFFPYLGYFRLLEVADTFVLLDNVQYQRRGWIHRNKFLKLSGIDDWLTLPIIKGNRDSTMIKDVRFKEGINGKDFISNFQISRDIDKIQNLWPNFFEFSGNLIDYLEKSLITTGSLLGINPTIVRASSITQKNESSAEDYILALCKTLEADIYVNAPGGRPLYKGENFEREKVKLYFLSEHRGPKTNILERILREDIKYLTAEICSNLELEEP